MKFTVIITLAALTMGCDPTYTYAQRLRMMSCESLQYWLETVTAEDTDHRVTEYGMTQILVEMDNKDCHRAGNNKGAD